MEAEAREAIKALIKRSETSVSGDVLKFTQAALNIAHVLVTLHSERKV